MNSYIQKMVWGHFILNTHSHLTGCRMWVVPLKKIIFFFLIDPFRPDSIALRFLLESSRDPIETGRESGVVGSSRDSMDLALLFRIKINHIDPGRMHDRSVRAFWLLSGVDSMYIYNERAFALLFGIGTMHYRTVRLFRLQIGIDTMHYRTVRAFNLTAGQQLVGPGQQKWTRPFPFVYIFAN